MAQLRGCMEYIDWDVFFSPSDDLDQTVTVISNYFAFCEDMIIHRKPSKSFPNIKLWITKELRKTINQKTDAYLKKECEEGKIIQSEIRRQIRYVRIQGHN